MASPQGSVTFFVTAYAAATAVAPGNLVMPISGTDGWVVATAAARGTTRCSGIAVSVTNGSGFGTVEIWQGGSIDPSITGLGAGTQSWVRASTAGFPERFTPTNGGSSDVIGYCETDGRLHLAMGVFTETMATGGGGGGASPAGNDGDYQTKLGAAFAAKTGNASGGPLIAPAALVVGDIYYAASTTALARLAKGADGQVLTIVSGLPAWVTAGAAFDPSSLSLTRWWRGSYSGLPQGGTSSSGSSGSFALATVSGNDPTPGTAVNGYAPAVYNGTNQQAVDGAVPGAFAVGSFSGWDLIYVPTLGTDFGAGARYQGGAIWDDSGNTQIQVCQSTAGATIGYIGGAGYKEATASLTAAAWQLVQYNYDGTTMKIRVNGGTWQTVATTPRATFGSNNLRYGQNTNAVFTSMRVLDTAKSNISMADSVHDQIRTYLASRYGLSI